MLVLHELRQRDHRAVSNLLIFNDFSEVLTKFTIELAPFLCIFCINMAGFLCFDPADQRRVTESQ